jgi:CBS domain-containing protein
MSIRKLCTANVVTAVKSMPVKEAARLMKENNIGNVVVVENETDNRPVGILTDRDIVIKILADEVDVENICVGDVMTEDLLILKQHQSINEAVEMMCAKGVRRAPIIDGDNKLCGIAAADDLLILIADELNSLARLVGKQIFS